MDPLRERSVTGDVLDSVAAAAHGYLSGVDERPVSLPGAAEVLAELHRPLPEEGVGAAESVAELLRVTDLAATTSSGPRFFHFVVGGSTPAAMAGDWVASLTDQVGGLWTSSPLATTLETVALGWLKDLFGLPESWGGVLTPSATFANLTGLAAARRWWAGRHGRDVLADGLAGLPAMPVFASGYVHPSVRKALQILGIGRDSVTVCARDDAGRIDLERLDRELAAAGGPAVVVACAGEVNTGDFDPIDAMADVCERHGAWLHVDGAFGLFAALSPRTAPLLAGVTRANSVAADGHKWLNVPYESGFVFVRDPEVLAETFGGWGVPYLASMDDQQIDYNQLGPESSRRARALPIWATLRAYGRDGHRAMVERHLDVAAHLGKVVEAAPDLELLAPVGLCIVFFRYRPDGVPEEELDELNAAVGRALLADGRVYAGTTVHRGMTAFRPAIVNWRTTETDVELLAEVIRELGVRFVQDGR
ncbi:aspartate aminotransferase family protein [Actinophytocola xinjiangensis]|uniref:Aspartate aminotransferase family protein n=1 Tax=Actinophytocola xinjiangensis TaxID=485602 RepID=A0A7Z1AX99_9PSEU|nr:pyridoxal-dependent decarboxylase [Actinophytocola xinjiangensis]OLF08028.1 aspartate aminotransferase family protein [Actinophytocola xinjiangensis]